jgi:hypothetical protein
MEELFVDFASVVALLIEAAAVVIVAYGSLEAFGRLVWMVVTPSATHGERKALTPQFTRVDNRGAVMDAAFAPDRGIARAFWRRWRGQFK